MDFGGGVINAVTYGREVPVVTAEVYIYIRVYGYIYIYIRGSIIIRQYGRGFELMVLMVRAAF